MNWGGDWLPRDTNFDNIVEGMLAMFKDIIATKLKQNQYMQLTLSKIGDFQTREIFKTA